MPLILASASPRRKELMELAGLTCQVLPAVGSETTDETQPGRIVEDLAAHKAREIFYHFAMDCSMNCGGSSPLDGMTVIGADTIVCCGGQVLGKPDGRNGAREMISMLQGRTHEVYTGVALLWRGADFAPAEVRFHECTEVEVWPMTDAEIDAYVATDEPYDKAGAYGIQGAFMRYVKGIKGDYSNVVGLPASRLYQELKENGRLGI